MAYVGTPLDTTNAFQSLAGKRFNGDASTTDFTLDSSPNSTLDIEVFVENVRQDPNSAYTVSGTTLAFTAAPPSGTNNIYVVHQAKAVGTIDVPSAGVQSGSLSSAFLTGQTDIGGAIADADLFLVDDGAGGTFRKTAASRIKTYIDAPDNTPCFFATLSSAQSINDSTYTKIQFDTEVVDSDGKYDNSSNYRFTPTVAGKYLVSLQISCDELDDQKRVEAKIYKNGSGINRSATQASMSGGNSFPQTSTNGFVVDLDADDYIEGYALQNHGSSRNIRASSETYFGAILIAGT